MTYETALAGSKKTGASKAEGLPLLAMTLKALSSVHAINPKMAYEGAMKNGLDAHKVRKLDPRPFGRSHVCMNESISSVCSSARSYSNTPLL